MTSGRWTTKNAHIQIFALQGYVDEGHDCRPKKAALDVLRPVLRNKQHRQAHSARK